MIFRVSLNVFVFFFENRITKAFSIKKIIWLIGKYQTDRNLEKKMRKCKIMVYRQIDVYRAILNQKKNQSGFTQKFRVSLYLIFLRIQSGLTGLKSQRLSDCSIKQQL